MTAPAASSMDETLGELPTDHDARGADSLVTCGGCNSQFSFGPNFCPYCGTSVGANAPQDPLVGVVIADRYRIVSVLGRGGMGVVYRCEHTKMGKAMAIKLLHGDLARDRKVLERFRREAQAVSRLSSPYTVSVFDYGTSDGLTYLVMEIVEGEDFGRLLRARGTISPIRLARICAQACESLAEAHDKGIIHRDVKPENILVLRGADGTDSIKLLDFGLARLRDSEERNEITHPGALLGTPYYMPPEVIRGREADARADIYALGAMLYRGLTGVPPFTGNSPITVLTKALTDELVPPSKRRDDGTVPPELEQIVLACLQKDLEKRPQHISEVRDALLRYLATASGEVSTTDIVKPRGAAPKAKAATRDDIEAFERSLRRGRIAGALLFVLVMAALAVAGLIVFGERRIEQRRALTARDSEVEPNNSAANATLIAAGTEVRGAIGQRADRTHGDVDFYKLPPIPPGQWRLRVELASQPNIDTVVEVFRSGAEYAVFVAREAGVGQREVVAGLSVQAGEQYFISLHEDERVTVPSENITDQYVLRYTLEPREGALESEPNEREALSSALSTNGERRGYIETAGDVDVWCPTALAQRTSFRITPPPGLDVQLEVSHHDGRATESIDNAAAGAAEIATLTPESGAPPCLTVRGSRAHPPRTGDAMRPYTIEPMSP